MKLLKIKSYLIGFIVVMISLFSFNSFVSAEEKNWTYNENYIEYLKENMDYNLLKDNTKELIDYIESNTNYDFIITFFLDTNTLSVRLNVFFFEDLSQNKIKSYDYDSYSSRFSFSLQITNINNQKFNGIQLTTGFDFEEMTDEKINYMFNEMKIKIDDFLLNNNFRYYANYDILQYSKPRYEIYSCYLTIPLYSSKNLIYDNISNINNEINIQFNDYLFTNNSTLNELIDNFSILNSSKIKLSKTYANDLEGNDIYNIRADFADIYDESYTYQFKTDFFNDWVDITENIQTAAQEGFYIYDYSCYYNTNIRFRVLDSNGEVLDENSINVSELNNFGMQISHNFATDLEGRDIYAITIDLRNCWENSYKYQYSYDNKNFYNMDVSEENKIYYLNHGINIPIYFQILDSNNNILWNTKYNGPFDNINKNIELKEFTGTDQSGNKFIGFEADLSDYTQFSDIYNFKVIINGIQQDLKDVIAWNIRENQFDNYNIDFELYLDELLIEKFNYNPKLGFDSFDDKYNDIVNNEMEEEINNGDYTSIDGIFEAVKSFIKAISDFINSFFKLIMVFFNRLNLWIKSAVIGIFIVMVVCRIIKAVRK